MPPSLAVSADPRLPAAVKPFRRRKLNDDEIPPDFMAILALVFGIIGTMSKVTVSVVKLSPSYSHELTNVDCCYTYEI
jgi:hypothetical protein